MKLIVISILSLIVCTQAKFQTSAKDFYDGKTYYEPFCDVKEDCPQGSDRCVAEVHTEQDSKILKRSMVCFSEDHKILHEDKDSGANTLEEEFGNCETFYPDGSRLHTYRGPCLKYVNSKTYEEYFDADVQLQTDNFELRKPLISKRNELITLCKDKNEENEKIACDKKFEDLDKQENDLEAQLQKKEKELYENLVKNNEKNERESQKLL